MGTFLQKDPPNELTVDGSVLHRRRVSPLGGHAPQLQLSVGVPRGQHWVHSPHLLAAWGVPRCLVSPLGDRFPLAPLGPVFAVVRPPFIPHVHPWHLPVV